MPRVFIVRHGESTSNLEKIISGRHDHVPLTDNGHEQAKQAGLHIASQIQHPIRIISSPLERAHVTAKHIADALKIPHEEIHIEPDLLERNFGDMEGRDGAELKHQPGYLLIDKNGRNLGADPKWRPNNGESLEDVMARAIPAVERAKQQNPNHHLVIVSHGHTLKTLLAKYLGVWRSKDTRMANAEVREIPYGNAVQESMDVFFHSWKCGTCNHTWVAQDDEEGRRCHACPGRGQVFESTADFLIHKVLGRL